MRVTNEQLKGIKQYDNIDIECCCSSDTSIYDLSDDLLDARELIDKQEALIKEMRSILNECDSDIMDGTVDRVVAILEKTKDYE